MQCHINWCPQRIKLTLAVGVVGLTCLCPAAADNPSGYIRKSSWHESLLASLEAVSRSGAEDGFAPFESETMRGGDAARQISVPLAGAKELYLFVTGVPDVKWAVADWADARLLRNDGSAESLTQATNFTVLLGRCEKDLTLKSGLYQKMRLNGRTFDRGLNVQADSVIRVPLDGAFGAVRGDHRRGRLGRHERFGALQRAGGAQRRGQAAVGAVDAGLRHRRGSPADEVGARGPHLRVRLASGRLVSPGAALRESLRPRAAAGARRPPGSPPTSRTGRAWNASGRRATSGAARWAKHSPAREVSTSTRRGRRSRISPPAFRRSIPATNLSRFDALQNAVTSALNRFQPDKLEAWTDAGRAPWRSSRRSSARRFWRIRCSTSTSCS